MGVILGEEQLLRTEGQTWERCRSDWLHDPGMEKMKSRASRMPNEDVRRSTCMRAEHGRAVELVEIARAERAPSRDFEYQYRSPPCLFIIQSEVIEFVHTMGQTYIRAQVLRD